MSAKIPVGCETKSTDVDESGIETTVRFKNLELLRRITLCGPIRFGPEHEDLQKKVVIASGIKDRVGNALLSGPVDYAAINQDIDNALKLLD